MSASTESAPSYDEFLAELGLLNRLCVDLRRGTVAGPLSRTGHTLPRLAYTPAITSLTSAIENYIQVAEHHVPSEEVWEELRAMKRGKERGRRETSFARAALVSIAALRLEVEKDEVTSKRNVELYQESLVRLIEEGKSVHARSSSTSEAHADTTQTLASLGTTARRYHRHARLPLYGFDEAHGTGRMWERAENPFVPHSRA